MEHCSPPWSRCLQCIFLAYQLLLPAPSSVMSDAGARRRDTGCSAGLAGAGQMCVPQGDPCCLCHCPLLSGRFTLKTLASFYYFPSQISAGCEGYF